MIDNYGQIFITFVIGYIIYITICIFFVTTIVYFTYRFWKMILPKEEMSIFVSNAPVIGSNNKKSEYNKDISDEFEGLE